MVVNYEVIGLSDFVNHDLASVMLAMLFMYFLQSKM